MQLENSATKTEDIGKWAKTAAIRPSLPELRRPICWSSVPILCHPQRARFGNADVTASKIHEPQMLRAVVPEYVEGLDVQVDHFTLMEVEQSARALIRRSG